MAEIVNSNYFFSYTGVNQEWKIHWRWYPDRSNSLSVECGVSPWMFWDSQIESFYCMKAIVLLIYSPIFYLKNKWVKTKWTNMYVKRSERNSHRTEEKSNNITEVVVQEENLPCLKTNNLNRPTSRIRKIKAKIMHATYLKMCHKSILSKWTLGVNTLMS